MIHRISFESISNSNNHHVASRVFSLIYFHCKLLKNTLLIDINYLIYSHIQFNIKMKLFLQVICKDCFSKSIINNHHLFNIDSQLKYCHYKHPLYKNWIDTIYYLHSNFHCTIQSLIISHNNLMLHIHYQDISYSDNHHVVNISYCLQGFHYKNQINIDLIGSHYLYCIHFHLNLK